MSQNIFTSTSITEEKTVQTVEFSDYEANLFGGQTVNQSERVSRSRRGEIPTAGSTQDKDSLNQMGKTKAETATVRVSTDVKVGANEPATVVIPTNSGAVPESEPTKNPSANIPAQPSSEPVKQPETLVTVPHPDHDDPAVKWMDFTSPTPVMKEPEPIQTASNEQTGKNGRDREIPTATGSQAGDPNSVGVENGDISPTKEPTKTAEPIVDEPPRQPLVDPEPPKAPVKQPDHVDPAPQPAPEESATPVIPEELVEKATASVQTAKVEKEEAKKEEPEVKKEEPEVAATASSVASFQKSEDLRPAQVHSKTVGAVLGLVGKNEIGWDKTGIENGYKNQGWHVEGGANAFGGKLGSGSLSGYRAEIDVHYVGNRSQKLGGEAGVFGFRASHERENYGNLGDGVKGSAYQSKVGLYGQRALESKDISIEGFVNLGHARGKGSDGIASSVVDAKSVDFGAQVMGKIHSDNPNRYIEGVAGIRQTFTRINSIAKSFETDVDFSNSKLTSITEAYGGFKLKEQVNEKMKVTGQAIAYAQHRSNNGGAAFNLPKNIVGLKAEAGVEYKIKENVLLNAGVGAHVNSGRRAEATVNTGITLTF